MGQVHIGRSSGVKEGHRTVKGPQQVHMQWILACHEKSASMQCENSIANNLVFVTHRAVKCALAD